MSESAVIERPTILSGGEPYPYRPESWDEMPFVRVSQTRLYESIQGEAIEENARRSHRSQLFEGASFATPMESHYRNSAWEETTVPFRLREDNDNYATRVARGIYNEAVIANDEWEAYAENARRADWEQALMAPAPVDEPTPERLTYERDQQAALAQAEILGATADQRRKLREIVQSEHDARRRVEELEAQAAELDRRLTAALNPITDPSDRRVWPIFGEAAREANKQGYCSVYDQISEAVNIPNRGDLNDAGYLPGRRWDVRVEVDISYTQSVTVTVEADNYDAAILAADDMSLADIFGYMDVNDHELERSDLDSHSAQEAEEVDE